MVLCSAASSYVVVYSVIKPAAGETAAEILVPKIQISNLLITGEKDTVKVNFA